MQVGEAASVRFAEAAGDPVAALYGLRCAQLLQLVAELALQVLDVVAAGV